MANEDKNKSKPLEDSLTSYEKIKSEVQANQAMNKLLRERVDYLKQLVVSGQQLTEQQQEFYKNASKSLKEEKRRIDSIREETKLYKELDGLASDFTKGIGKLPGVMGAVNKKIEVTKQGVSVMSDTLRDARDITKQQKEYAQQSISTYVKLTSVIGKSQKKLEKGEITLSQYNKSVIEIGDSFDDVISKIDTSTKSGKRLAAQLKNARKENDDFVSSAKKSAQRMEQLNGAMDRLGSSGIPLMDDLSGMVKDLANKDLKGARLGFIALGAAAGAMFSKVIPGLAQMNAGLKAGNDIIQTQIDLRRELAKIDIESGYIPQKIEEERFSNMIEGQMQINKLALEGQYAPQKIAEERLQNEIESANTVNRLLIDAQYAAKRAANSFSAQMKSGAAQFAAAAKTARSGGEQLGDVGYNTAQLQLAGISADQISSAMSETAGLLGSMPTEKVAAGMSIFAKMSGVAESEVAQIADMMNLIDGYSLEASLNLQAGVKQLAKRSNISFSNLMKGIAASSKKMMEYGIMNSKQLAKQVAYAQSMGADFNSIADAGRNMVLNYRDSIKGEMKLSAILGRQIDLSEVRQKFYEGDTIGAQEALRRQGITKEELRSPFAQEALKEAAGGMDMETFLKVIDRNGKEAGEIQAGSIEKTNNRFLKRFQKAQEQLSAREAVIQADAAIIDARLSEKITDAYLKSPGYLQYQNNLNNLAQQQAALSTEITDAWLNSPGNMLYQQNLAISAKRQAQLNQAIEESFLSSKAYRQSIVDEEKLNIRRGFTENLVPTIGAIGGGALFNMIGNKMFGGGAGISGTTGTTGGTTSMFSKAAPGGSVSFGNVAGAGFGSNLSGALKSGGTITGGVISGLTSGFMEFSENKQLGISMGENIGRTTTKAISAGVGGWGGASLGAAIGTAIFPGVGTLVGGFLGGWLGGKGGDKLGDAINTGIYGSKQERIKKTQEAQLSTQEDLQKQMSLNKQVDVNYYKRALQLNEQQVAQLQKYNQTQAITPDWYKQGPGWLNNLKPGQNVSQTYLGSGLPLMPGTLEGDASSPFGRRIEKYFDSASGKFSYEIKEVTEKEYGKFYEQFTGKKFTKSVVEQAKKEAMGPGGKIKITEGSKLEQGFSASFKKSDAEIYADFIKGQQQQIETQNRLLQSTPKEKLTKDQLVKREQLDKESKIAIETALKNMPKISPAEYRRTADMPPYLRAQQEKFNSMFQSFNLAKPNVTYGDGKKTGEVKALGFDPKATTLDPKKQTESTKEGVEAANKKYERSPSLGVTLDKDNSGLYKKIIESLEQIRINTANTSLNTALGNIRASSSYTTSSFNFPSFGLRRGFAKGKKSNNTGGMAMVGERGPELMYVPNSASIVPNGDTNRIKNGDVSKLSKWGIPGYADGKGGKDEPVKGPLAKAYYGSLGKILPFKGNTHILETLAMPSYQNIGMLGLSKIGLSPGYTSKPKTSNQKEHNVINYLLTLIEGGKHFAHTIPHEGGFLKRLAGTFGIGSKAYAQGAMHHGHQAKNLFQHIRSFLPAAGETLTTSIGTGLADMGTRFSQTFLRAEGLKKFGGGLLKGTKNMMGKMAVAQSIYGAVRSMYDAGTGDMALHSRGTGDYLKSAGEMFGGQAADLLNSTTFGLSGALGMNEFNIRPLDGADTARLRALWRLQNPKEPTYENMHNQNVKVMRWLESKFLYLQPENYGRGTLNDVMRQLNAAYGVQNPDLYNLWKTVGTFELFKPGFSYQGPPITGGTVDFTNIKSENLITKGDRQNIANKIKTYWDKFAKPNVPLSIAGYAPYSTGQSGVGPFKQSEIENLKKVDWASQLTTYGAPGTDGWNGKPEFIQRIKDFYIGNYLKGGPGNKQFIIPSHKKYEKEALAHKNIYQKIGSGFSTAGNFVANKASALVGGAKNMASKAYSGAKNMASSAWNTITGFFANGVNSAPGGPAVVGERGAEMMLHRGMASIIGMGGPEIRNVPKGAEVIPNHKLPRNMPAMADGTIGATAALLSSNNTQMQQLANKIADAITNAASNGQAQNINLIVDGRQLNNIQYRRQQNRIGARPNDLV